LDIKNAFLNDILNEEVYMEQASGFIAHREYANKVCRLKKSLYGLKQFPKTWFGRFASVIHEFDLYRIEKITLCFDEYSMRRGSY